MEPPTPSGAVAVPSPSQGQDLTGEAPTTGATTDADPGPVEMDPTLISEDHFAPLPLVDEEGTANAMDMDTTTSLSLPSGAVTHAAPVGQGEHASGAGAGGAATMNSPDALNALAAAVLAQHAWVDTEADGDGDGPRQDVGLEDISSSHPRENETMSSTEQTHDFLAGPSTIPSRTSNDSAAPSNHDPSATFGQPPYTPTSNVVYPPDSIPNPYLGDMSTQPTFDNLPSGSLFRPAYLPGDIDGRVDKSSVWMGIDRASSKAVYFLPPTCKGCNNPAVAQFCDRGQPKCSRCVNKNLECVPGSIWGVMRPRGKRRLRADYDSSNGTPNGDGERRLTAEEKGKGRATADSTATNGSAPGVSAVATTSTVDDEGRGKRVKKKRRLSASGEVDPMDYDDHGDIRKPMRHPSKPTLPLSSQPHEDPQTVQERRAMESRLEQNQRRPPLVNMCGSCPAWANSRRTLSAAVEYLREPVQTPGASVEISVGGIARGVIFQGEAPDKSTFWKMAEVQDEAGTIVTSIGPARPTHGDQPAMPSQVPPDLTTTLENRGSAEGGKVIPIPSQTHTLVNPSQHVVEAPEIAALLAAHRAKTPVAVAVTSDYSGAPFKVPRAVIVLGWFWITQAWLEPVAVGNTLAPAEDLRVRWKFRFDWCHGQWAPWWLPQSVNFRLFPDFAADPEDVKPMPATVFESGVTGNSSTTVQPARGSQVDETRYICPTCQHQSTRVYKRWRFQGVCLNSTCPKYFQYPNGTIYDKAHNDPAPIPDSFWSGWIRPSRLDLKLCPEEPSSGAPSREPDTGGGRANAGRDFWRAWVCEECAMANERRRWSGWECEACKRTIRPERKIYEADYFRSPSRPVYTGPRQEDGYPSWPFPTSRAWTLFADDVKVVKHAVESGLGEGAEVHHALASRPISADILFRRLQAQGALEVPFRRQLLDQNHRQRAKDKAGTSPFYTFLCGSEAPSIEALPAGNAVPWKKCVASCFDAIDLVNDMAGRMFPGQRERFNSLLLAVFPPQLPAALQPKITVPPNSHFALMFLGPDGGVKIVRHIDGKRGRQGSLTAVHGDVVGIKTASDPIEVTPHMDGFGFLCVARQVYRSTALPTTSGAAQHSVTPELSLETEGRPAITGAIGAINPKPKPRPLSLTKLTPKPSKLLPQAPLTDWYIGTRPLDRVQPRRLRPPLKQRPSNRSEEVAAEASPSKVPGPSSGPSAVAQTGVEGIIAGSETAGADGGDVETPAPQWKGTEEVETLPTPELVRPPPISPMGKKKKIDLGNGTPQSDKAHKSEKGEKGGKRGKADDGQKSKKREKGNKGDKGGKGERSAKGGAKGNKGDQIDSPRPKKRAKKGDGTPRGSGTATGGAGTPSVKSEAA